MIKGIPRRANKSFLFNGYFVSKTCQEISLPTSFKILISIILGTNLPITDAAILGGLRTEKIFRNNNKKTKEQNFISRIQLK